MAGEVRGIDVGICSGHPLIIGHAVGIESLRAVVEAGKGLGQDSIARIDYVFGVEDDVCVLGRVIARGLAWITLIWGTVGKLDSHLPAKGLGPEVQFAELQVGGVDILRSEGV